jgi:4-amino-4-deoxy-L-arabinose transferase-like glycosyltransferase
MEPRLAAVPAAADPERPVAWGWPVRAVLWALLVALLAWGLGFYPLLDPDEGRNSEVAREMAASGDYVLPRLDGIPYLDKPVGFFAVDALAQRLLGSGETAARLPALCFALATAALTGWFAGRLFGRGARQVAALAALVAPLPIAFARTVIFDSMLSFFLTLALCAFYLAIDLAADQAADQGGERGRQGAAPASHLGWTVLAWAAIGAGILVKGPVALAVPLLAAVPYAVWRRASRAVWHPAGPAALALVVGPWLWAMSRQVPEFLHYALVIETWQRVATPVMRREAPFWFYVPCLLAGALPWTMLVLAGWRRSLRLRTPGGRPDKVRLYLALWIAVPFVMFSLSHSKRPQYILPLLPAVALLAAKVWVDAAGGQTAPGDGPDGAATAGRAPGQGRGDQANVATTTVPGVRAVAFTWSALAALCLAAVPVLARSHLPAVTGARLLPPTLLGVAGVFAAGAVVLFAAVRTGAESHARRDPGNDRPDGRWSGGTRRAAALLGLVLPVAALPALALPLLDEIGGHRSARAAAAAILDRLPPGAEVVGVRAFPPSLPFYLRRTVLVASPRGRELTSNYVIAYLQKWMSAAPGQTPLRPFAWWHTALAACDHPLVFVAWSDDAASRADLAASGLPLFFANDRMAAYGPCAPRTQGGR